MNEQHLAKRPESELRASDAERDEVAQVLSQHFAEGRLDQVEFDERLGRAMSAKTRGDLATLLLDLPSVGKPRPINAGQRRRSRIPVPLIAVVLFFVIASSRISGWQQGGHPLFVPFFPLLVLGSVALVITRRHRQRSCVSSSASSIRDPL